MYGAFVITLREGLEAFLVVAILLACLNRVGATAFSRFIWAGVGLAVLASAVAAGALQAVALQFTARAAALFEAGASLLAAAVLTWMVHWMQGRSRSLRNEVETAAARAVRRGETWGLAALAFTTVAREGLETVLFLFALAAGGRGEILAGAAAGLAAAGAVVVAVFRSSRRVNLRAFFLATGVLLVVIAAGFLAHTVRGLQEAGVLAEAARPAWDTSRWLPDVSLLGGLLHAFAGYTARPSAAEVVPYVGYLIVSLGLFVRAAVMRPAGPAAAARAPLPTQVPSCCWRALARWPRAGRK